jgi:hypothetical protein
MTLLRNKQIRFRIFFATSLHRSSLQSIQNKYKRCQCKSNNKRFGFVCLLLAITNFRETIHYSLVRFGRAFGNFHNRVDNLYLFIL